MSDQGLEQARAKMVAHGVDPVAIEVFAHYYRLVESGETGMIPESTIAPLDMPALADVEVSDAAAAAAIGTTAVIKLNGGLGTSMGMDRAKSLLSVGRGLNFLDVIVRQVLHLRMRYDVRLPLIFMNSFRTSADTLLALARYRELALPDLPLQFLQNQEPKLRADNLKPVTWTPDPTMEWCPPGHGDMYTALHGNGLIGTLLDAGFEQVFVSNSDNLGAVADPRVAGWFAESGAPFAIEAARRTAGDKKGGHFARRLSDDRIVLRETAQTPPEDLDALADLDRHRFCSTNNLWFNLRAMADELQARKGILELPMIRNVKTVDPTDATSPEVIQIETAMGAAIEIFDGARTIEVGRDRFVPVKTTNDLLLLRSDAYELAEGSVIRQVAETLPYVELSSAYKRVGDFDRRFPQGPPSLKDATSFVVPGDMTFGRGVRVVGDVVVGGDHGRIGSGTVLGDPA